MTNTSRTLQHCRNNGWIVDVVERFVPAGEFGIRRDFLGIIDMIAITESRTIGVQSCGQNFAEHDRKIRDNPNSVEWLGGGRELMLIGWRKIKKVRGGKQVVWAPRIMTYMLNDESNIVGMEWKSE